MKYDVFISYSRKDKHYVLAFANELRNAGFNIWIDQDGIHSSEDFKNRIVEAISDSTCFIFFSSAAANKSGYTVKEVGVAVSLKKPIIPIKLDKSPYANSILFDLVNVDFIDITEHQQSEVLKRTITALASLCGERVPINQPVNSIIRHKRNRLFFGFNLTAKKKVILITFLSVIIFGVLWLSFSPKLLPRSKHIINDTIVISDNSNDTMNLINMKTSFGYWTGQTIDSVPQGEGVLSYFDNDIDDRVSYSGSMENGKRHGKGRLTYKNGNIFEGTFCQDSLLEGEFIQKNDGLYFKGNFVKNSPYDGEWRYVENEKLYSIVKSGIESN